MNFILSTGSVAIFHSAWYMNLPMFSLDWVLYCIAWLPLLMLLASAFKFYQTNKSSRISPKVIATIKLNSPMQ